MKASTRYWLFQLPGWFVTAAVLYGFHQWSELPLWGAGMVMLLLIVKDAILYPFLKIAYEVNAKTGVEQLIGQDAVAEQDLSPQGLVRIRGELWRARLGDRQRTVPAGSIVRIESGKGLTLVVSAPPSLPAKPREDVG